MSTKKKASGRKDGETISKEQEEVAKFLRFNLNTSSTLFQGNEVHYFSGNKAVDFLLDSKYGTKAKKDPLFTTRNQVINYLDEFVQQQLFVRAKKLVPKKKDDKKKEADKAKRNEDTVTETENEEKEKKDKEVKDKDVKKDDDEKKKKKKVKLEFHSTQVFVDDKDVYIWIFDPTPLYKKVIGFLIVLGTIAGCLFPLWPMWLRQAIYYLSLVGIFAFGAIVGIAILRTILFGVIWLATMGRHKLWIFPNLTEDCGFFDSFKPFYTYEYCPNGSKTTEMPKVNKKKKSKNSDDEEENPLVEDEKENEDNVSADENDDVSGDESANEEGASTTEDVSDVPPSPEEKVKKRRPRRVDDGFVHVK